MDVFHVAKHYHPDVGGIESATKDLAEAAVEAGVNVKCLASCSNQDKQRSFNHNGVVVVKYPAKKLMSSPVSFRLFFMKIPSNSVIHLHTPNPFAELWILCLMLLKPKFRKQVVPFFHAYPVGQGLIGKLWFQIITAAIFKHVDHILMSNADFFRAFPVLNRWKSKFQILSFFASPIGEEKFLEYLPLRLDEKMVLAIGRLVKYKGYDILMRAWSVIETQQRFLDVHLVIVGEGPERRNLEKLILELGLKRVRLLGAVNEDKKKELLERACLFTAPSISEAETFGISILEAMSYGLPVVTTDIKTGMATLARAGACGALVEPRNPQALYEGLSSMLDDLNRNLVEVGHSNIDFVKGEFSSERGRKMYVEFLNEHFLS